jgi:hypothetical protein
MPMSECPVCRQTRGHRAGCSRMNTAEPKPRLNGMAVASTVIEPPDDEEAFAYFPWLTPEVVADPIAALATLEAERRAEPPTSKPRCAVCGVIKGHPHRPECIQHAPGLKCPECGARPRGKHLETCSKSKSFKGGPVPEPKIKMVPLKPDPGSVTATPPTILGAIFDAPKETPKTLLQRELRAMEVIAGELEGLDAEARSRVVRWVSALHKVF